MIRRRDSGESACLFDSIRLHVLVAGWSTRLPHTTAFTPGQSPWESQLGVKPMLASVRLQMGIVRTSLKPGSVVRKC